jgi:23S rRNA pseudouridine955/2504/2580 synthase|tara:strand:- start:4930 stop:5835 length:906 start_codon:yes stop_codon:yes gene_type:complete
MFEVINIDDSSVGFRIDKWIKKKLTKIPQSLIEKDLRNGKIKVNKKKVKSSYKLIKNDKIYLFNFDYKNLSIVKKSYIPKNNIIKETEKDIIENNNNFIVINKKAGLPVQGGTKINENVTNIFSNSIYFKDYKPFIVHRIDKETSGILIIAKNRETAQQLTSLFRIRKIHKTYLALSFGQIDKEKNILDNNLIRYEGNKKIMERAITHYHVIDKNNKYTLFKLKPITGRKHQIRKHLIDLGYPVVGDNKYFLKKQSKNKHLMLHAYEIKFILNNTKYNFKANIPVYFKDFLIKNNLKQKNF